MIVLFVIPASGGGGGAHSVVQESAGLVELGIQCRIAVDPRHRPSFRLHYPDLAGAGVDLRMFTDVNDLEGLARDCDVVVATTPRSVHLIRDVIARLAQSATAVPRAFYYIQDYEPLFHTPYSSAWHEARASYELIENAVLFAKTKWVQDIVYANHGARVEKVAPSLDHAIFRGKLRPETEGGRIAAMLRPPTPRRAPFRTARVSNALVERYGGSVDIQLFGFADEELDEAGIELSPQIRRSGRLTREDVAEVLRSCDLFLDLSDFQAFGRTGIESMACGCIPVLPRLGGASEYARHGKNAYVVDTRSDAAILEAVDHFVRLEREERQSMVIDAMATAQEMSVKKAALSLLKLFRSQG